MNVLHLCCSVKSKKITTTKQYPENEENPMVANEPAVAYGRMSSCISMTHRPSAYEMEILRRSEEDSKAGRIYTQEEVDTLLERWLN